MAALFFLGVLACLRTASARAQTIQGEPVDQMREQTSRMAGQAGFNPDTSADSVSEVISVVIEAFLGLLGVIFLILIIIAGVNWMTAGGNQDKVDKAKKTLSRALIGLVIVVSAYAITYFVFKYLGEATSDTMSMLVY